MEEIRDFSSEESRMLSQLKEVFSHIQLAGQANLSSIDSGLEIIRSLRRLIYEDMNQLQHEALILKIAKLLQNDFYPNVVKWLWNPRQTGRKDEPDLRGLDDRGEIVISTEVTTSENPQGTIDTRMARTLEKLSAMPGDKYYVVVTTTMESRAKSKVRKLSYPINVIRIETN